MSVQKKRRVWIKYGVRIGFLSGSHVDNSVEYLAFHGEEQKTDSAIVDVDTSLEENPEFPPPVKTFKEQEDEFGHLNTDVIDALLKE